MILCNSTVGGKVIMIYEIRPIAEDHTACFRETLDAVAREQRFLSFLEALPLEQMRHFVLKNINEGYPQFVVLIDDQIGRWCDCFPTLQGPCRLIAGPWIRAFCRSFVATELVASLCSGRSTQLSRVSADHERA
jgi:hypothetical protein